MDVKDKFQTKFKRGEHEVRELLRVYLVTDDALCVHHNLMDVVQMAVRAGVTCVQLREKHLSTGAFVAKARALKELLDRYAPDVPLLINDRVDVALAAGADGVHVGQDDMQLADVRALMPQGLIGLSVHSAQTMQAAMAQRSLLDYVGLGPIYPTMTKTDAAEPVGLDGIAQIRAMSSVPLVAIGGIGVDNAQAVMRQGADGVAVVSAICSAAQPDHVVQHLSTMVRQVLSVQPNRISGVKGGTR